MRILMPSIVDPREARGGAWTATRGLIRVLELAWPGVAIECIPALFRSRAAHRLRQLRCLAQGAAGIGLPPPFAPSLPIDGRSAAPQALAYVQRRVKRALL